MRIVLRDYDPAWPERFDVVHRRLVGALGDAALAVEHVGSTSVPGLCAKPVIDVVLAVADSSDEAAYATRLEEGGFRLRHREPEWHEHRLFELGRPAVNIHVFSSGCPEIDRMVLFRDHLRRDAHARAAYALTKRELAEREWTSVQAYADAKSDVVARLLDTAGDPRDEPDAR